MEAVVYVLSIVFYLMYDWIEKNATDTSSQIVQISTVHREYSLVIDVQITVSICMCRSCRP